MQLFNSSSLRGTTNDLFFRLNQPSLLGRHQLRRGRYTVADRLAGISNGLRPRSTCCAVNRCQHARAPTFSPPNSLTRLAPQSRTLCRRGGRPKPTSASSAAHGDESVSSVLGCRYRDPVLLTRASETGQSRRETLSRQFRIHAATDIGLLPLPPGLVRSSRLLRRQRLPVCAAASQRPGNLARSRVQSGTRNPRTAGKSPHPVRIMARYFLKYWL